mmetsp:Transcript_8458/g.24963  ORF Transcript_8458/g.24963 Transcript_8458/m.24963 type:complete len:290 (+) Transcript_8458:122-991(+)
MGSPSGPNDMEETWWGRGQDLAELCELLDLARVAPCRQSSPSDALHQMPPKSQRTFSSQSSLPCSVSPRKTVEKFRPSWSSRAVWAPHSQWMCVPEMTATFCSGMSSNTQRPCSFWSVRFPKNLRSSVSTAARMRLWSGAVPAPPQMLSQMWESLKIPSSLVDGPPFSFEPFRSFGLRACSSSILRRSCSSARRASARRSCSLARSRASTSPRSSSSVKPERSEGVLPMCGAARMRRCRGRSDVLVGERGDSLPLVGDDAATSLDESSPEPSSWPYGKEDLSEALGTLA